MARIIHLHIGSPKTATSLVQNHFARTGVLAANRIAYPSEFRARHGVAHHPLAHKIMVGDIDAAMLGLDPALQGDVDVLMSSEAFINCITAPDRMRGVGQFLRKLNFSISSGRLGHFEHFLRSLAARAEVVHVIVFLREASAFFESMYLHTVKITGLDSPFDDYLAARKHWYRNLFKGLHAIACHGGGVVPKIYPFLPHRYPADWNEALGVDVGIDTGEQVNRRLSLKTQAILMGYKRFRAATGTSLDRRGAVARFNAADSPFQDDTCDFSLFRPGQAEAVGERALAAARKFGCQQYVDAFAAGPTAGAAPHAELDYGLLTPQDIAAARDFLHS